MYKVHTKPNQTRTPQLPQDIRKPNKRVSFSTGVTPTTSVSRPQLKSNQLEDRVMPNNSQGKKQNVEDHRRNFNFSNNKTSVTACNDSLNAKTSNVNFVYVTCGKCVLQDNHDLCVLHYINGVNSRTKQPIAVPISTREPKQNVNHCVATSSKKTVAIDSTVKKFRNTTRKPYEQVSKTCSWWYPKYTPSGYKWKPKSQKEMLTQTLEESLEMVNGGPILGYGDLVQGTITIKRVYYVEGLNHNLFFVGQFCDADLEVAFWKSTCYIRDLKGNDLLTGSRGTDLYSITLQDSTSPNPICLMAKATSSQAWLWHRRLSHLNFDTINLLSKNNIVNGLPKLKFIKDHLCSSCELGKAKRKSFHTKTTPSSKRQLQLLYMDLCGPMRYKALMEEYVPLRCLVNYSMELLPLSKSSVVHAADNPNKRQQHNTTHTSTTTDVADPPPLNIHSTHQTPTQNKTSLETVADVNVALQPQMSQSEQKKHHRIHDYSAWIESIRSCGHDHRSRTRTSGGLALSGMEHTLVSWSSQKAVLSPNVLQKKPSIVNILRAANKFYG
ncbi:retrovirus-related pol polyprotein from transposon TNT 1-94 [Tanacetum coccineum]